MLQKDTSCLLFLGDTSILCPAEIKGDSSTAWCRWCRNTQFRAGTLMPGSVSTTTVVRGPISLTATRECGSPEPYHFCFYFHLQCVHRSHTYAAPRVGGQAGQSCHRHPQPSPGARAGADKGSRQHPDTVKLSQGFKTDVIGGLGKKKKRFS